MASLGELADLVWENFAEPEAKTAAESQSEE